MERYGLGYCSLPEIAILSAEQYKSIQFAVANSTWRQKCEGREKDLVVATIDGNPDSVWPKV